VARSARHGKLHADLAQDLVHEKQYDLALAEALRAADSGAAGGRAGINLAVLENQVGAFGDAARLAEAIEEEGGLPEKVRAAAAGIAGLSYESSGQLQEAIRHFKLAIRLEPDQEQAYLALARICAAQQDNHAAVEVLEQARKTLGGSPKVLLALGSALMSTEQYEAASRMLSGLIQSFPDQLEAYPKLAEVYRNLGEPRRATETLRQLARHKPDDPMLHAVIAQSMLDEEQIDYARVLQELAEAEKASPDDYDVHYLRGKVFLATGRYVQAVASLRHAIELRPAGAYYQLGMAYQLGQTDLAKERLQDWVSEGPTGRLEPEIERPRSFPFPSGEVRKIDRCTFGSDRLLAQGNDHTPGGGIVHVYGRLDLVAHSSHELVQLHVVLAAVAGAARRVA
jgi:tetratricopeptide (TPR) repeat protein